LALKFTSTKLPKLGQNSSRKVGTVGQLANGKVLRRQPIYAGSFVE